MNDKEKLISLLILTDPNPYTCESESGSCELTTCTECRARSTADLLIENDFLPVVRCKDCKHQFKIWHADKRMKEKGYWIYSCKRNSDPFVSHTVNGYDDEYCCYGERKKGENDK